MRTRRDEHHARPASAVAAPADARRRDRPPRDPALGVAAAASRMAPAGAGALAADRRRRGDDGRARRSSSISEHRPGRAAVPPTPGSRSQARARPASPPMWPRRGSGSARSRRSSTRACRCPGRSLRWTCAPRIRTGSFSKPMLRLVSGRYPAGRRRGGGHPGSRDDVQPEGRLGLDGQRARAARRRHRRKSQGFAGRFRAGGSRSDQLAVERDAALQLHHGTGPIHFRACRRRTAAGDHAIGRQLGAGASQPGDRRPAARDDRADVHRAAVGRRLHRDGAAPAARARHDRRDRRHRPASAPSHAGQRGGGRRRGCVYRRGTRARGVVRADSRVREGRRPPLRPVGPALVGGHRRRDPGGADRARRLVVAGACRSARLPIVEALSGRPAPPQPAHRFALLGTAPRGSGFRRADPGPQPCTPG